LRRRMGLCAIRCRGGRARMMGVGVIACGPGTRIASRSLRGDALPILVLRIALRRGCMCQGGLRREAAPIFPLHGRVPIILHGIVA
jgi:hypothetical protein